MIMMAATEDSSATISLKDSAINVIEKILLVRSKSEARVFWPHVSHQEITEKLSAQLSGSILRIYSHL